MIIVVIKRSCSPTTISTYNSPLSHLWRTVLRSSHPTTREWSVTNSVEHSVISKRKRASEKGVVIGTLGAMAFALHTLKTSSVSPMRSAPENDTSSAFN